jgi:hypothetical protein
MNESRPLLSAASLAGRRRLLAQLATALCAVAVLTAARRQTVGPSELFYSSGVGGFVQVPSLSLSVDIVNSSK